MAEAISDVRIHIDLLKPAAKTGLGQPAIFVTGAASKYEEFTSIDALEDTYARTTAVYQKAAAIFKQENAPSKVSVITFKEGEAGLACETYFDKAWHFALLAEYVAADALAISNFIEEKGFKFAVFQVSAVADVTQFAKNARTIVYIHPRAEENIDAAVVGNTSSLNVGSVTWKFRHNLVGVTANDISSIELKAIHEAGALAYVSKAAIPQTSEGVTVGGEYIDAIHGDDWIKANLETRIQTLMTNTDKITFDQTGIALLQSEVKTVLEEAYKNGIIDTDDATGEGNYTITAAQRSDLKAEDISKRVYKGLSFYYKRAGAIHEVDVYGTIEV
ncbi:DUF3383 family protein [Listeria ilorinensis]|uniref:DUF3383 family protein n=1 Tax=Listeria ilorinensis TaxID=2867439 RepID=UPI001EF58195|nr:DUF3383 family protein [Listeria ilorinensis]